MKTIGKIAAAAAALSVMTLPSFGVSAAEGADYGDLFVMGDSITTGYGLDGYEAGNNYSAKDSFANKLAVSDLFGYSASESDNYANFAVDGRTSEELLDAVTNDEAFRDRISSADEIVISIGGNDLLVPLAGAAMGAMMNDQDFMNQVLDGTIPADEAASMMYEKYADVLIDTAKNIDLDSSSENISNIFETICQLNNDCDVYILTVYNPFDYDFDAENAEDMEGFVDISEERLIELNDSIFDAAAEYDNIYVIDVHSAFEGAAGEFTNIPDGDIHPNKKGHEVIFGLLSDSITENSAPASQDENDVPAETAETEAAPAGETPAAEPASAETAAEEVPPAPASDSTSNSVPTGNIPAEVFVSAAAVSLAAAFISRRRKK